MDNCTICLESIGDFPQMTLSCSHVFHVNCLYQLTQYHQKCPNCRIEFERPFEYRFDCHLVDQTETQTITMNRMDVNELYQKVIELFQIQSTHRLELWLGICNKGFCSVYAKELIDNDQFYQFKPTFIPPKQLLFEVSVYMDRAIECSALPRMCHQLFQLLFPKRIVPEQHYFYLDLPRSAHKQTRSLLGLLEPPPLPETPTKVLFISNTEKGTLVQFERPILMGRFSGSGYTTPQRYFLITPSCQIWGMNFAFENEEKTPTDIMTYIGSQYNLYLSGRIEQGAVLKLLCWSDFFKKLIDIH